MAAVALKMAKLACIVAKTIEFIREKILCFHFNPQKSLRTFLWALKDLVTLDLLMPCPVCFFKHCTYWFLKTVKMAEIRWGLKGYVEVFQTVYWRHLCNVCVQLHIIINGWGGWVGNEDECLFDHYIREGWNGQSVSISCKDSHFLHSRKYIFCCKCSPWQL